MILVHALQQLFPNADFQRDIILANEGQGDYIKEWNLPDPQPTQAEFEAAWQAWQSGAATRAAREQEIQQAPILARQWFIDNPATLQLFTLSIAELETEITNHVNALFPAALLSVRTKEVKIRMAELVAIRVLIKRELS